MRPSPLAIFGKIAREPDFVRHNIADPASQALFRWLSDAVAVRHEAGEPPLKGPCGVLWRTDGAAAIGWLVPSRDEIGRRFPLALLHTLPDKLVADTWTALPRAYAEFFETAHPLLLDAAEGQTDLPTLVSHIQKLAPPSESTIHRHLDACEGLVAGMPREDFDLSLFGDQANDVAAYAFYTFRLACDGPRFLHQKVTTRILDCPIPEGRHIVAWLEMARRFLKKRRVGRVALWAPATGRMLINIGPMSPRLLAHLRAPDLNDGQLWPLTTKHPTAHARAAKLLGRIDPKARMPETPLDDWIGALERSDLQ